MQVSIKHLIAFTNLLKVIVCKVFIVLICCLSITAILMPIFAANAYSTYQQGYNTYNFLQNSSNSYRGDYGGYSYPHSNNPQADYDMAYNFYIRGDFESSLPLFARLCEQNNFIACLSAGIVQGKMIDSLENDKRFSRSERKRLKEEYYTAMMAFYQKSCNGGNYDACNNLAFYEYNAIATRKKEQEKEQKAQAETNKTIELYAKSCKAGNKEACQNLGVIYSGGVGNTKKDSENVDLARAQSYYNKSCTMGDSVACFNLGVLRYNYAKVASDYAQAIHYFNQACGSDYPAACLNLGIIYERGVTQDANDDLANALQYYTKACYLKNTNACTYLSKLANKRSKID